jgi:beta-glucosidase
MYLLRPFYLLITILGYLTIQGQQLNLDIQADSILARMTLEEKIGQLNLRGTSSRVKGLSEELIQQVKKGEVGAVLNINNPELSLELQKIAVTQSRLGIPLLFGRDVIHGYKTIFPIPLALAASWNMDLIQQSSTVAAQEAYSQCINWTFAPMVDISRDARWGRIAESPGEDPYLACLIAKAYVKGFQGKDLRNPGSILACAKHYAAYGAAEGGRDYNTVNMSMPILHDVYLKPFEAAMQAEVATFMSSFNDVNGVPASGNSYLLKDVLRTKWNYKGFVVSDWNSVTEMIPHGYCADEKEASWKAFAAGMEMEMMSKSFERHLKELIQSGKISETQLNSAVKNILRIKLRAGLFQNPYFKNRNDFKILAPESLELAKQAAIKSSVLLKNENRILPLSSSSKIALIGPLANANKEQLGTWIFDGDKKDSQTPFQTLSAQLPESQLTFASGIPFSRSYSEDGFKAAWIAAKKSDVIIFVGGEEAILSGEAHSRADIGLPGAQEKLLLELSKTGKPIVLVLMSGRPISLEKILPKLSAVLLMWHPGTMAGPAFSDLIFGKANPSGKLPVTWPKNSGQIPFYYNHPNTGRPADPKTFVGIDSIPIEAWQSSLGNNSHYLDAGYAPQFPFGYGLSYSSFQYSNLKISKEKFRHQDSIEVQVELKNTSAVKGTETVQVYIQDITASLVRPVKELKAFQQIELTSGETKILQFKISVQQLGFHSSELKYLVEPGSFNLWVGTNSETGLKEMFEVVKE